MANEDQIDRLVAAIRCQRLILQGMVGAMVANLPDPIAAAREMRQITADKFVDAVPGGKMDRERETRINHYAAHFAEEFWTAVERTIQRTS